ncbi:hypothetical protein RMATCC62417_10276 [Rhizopus microsporus]|nr:hypothetical protein RMATCC62417_10276 [Rhizopus microsporus]
MKINSFLKLGFNAATILNVLRAEGIDNVIQKNIENKHYRFFQTEKSKQMHEYIIGLQKQRNDVKYAADGSNKVDMVFFFFSHESSILEARRMSESIIINATYKSNIHRPVFVNIVGTSNGLASRGNSLNAFEIAGTWITEGKEHCYEWVLKCLKESAWPISIDGNVELPSVIVTDDDKALRAAIRTVFPVLSIFFATFTYSATLKPI